MRLANLDNYGHTAFVDGFDVTQKADPTKYAISAGVAYVGGLRAVLDAEVIQTISTKPNCIYLDVVRMGTVLSEWQNVVTIRLSEVELVDYLDENNQQHYVAKLAGINADGSVSDWRVKGGLGEHESASDPHTQYLTRADFLKHMLFKGMPMSAVGPDPDPDIWLPAGRVELLREDYTTVFEIVSASTFFTDQATIDADPRAYAGHWGDGDGATTFTTDDWALMMNIKVAGGYGAAGATKEDHIQNIVASTTGNLGIGSFDGAFVASNSGPNNTNGGTAFRTLTFDASLVARADLYTDTMGLFLGHYRVIPKGAFSYV
jgi:hypothetical protein